MTSSTVRRPDTRTRKGCTKAKLPSTTTTNPPTRPHSSAFLISSCCDHTLPPPVRPLKSAAVQLFRCYLLLSFHSLTEEQSTRNMLSQSRKVLLSRTVQQRLVSNLHSNSVVTRWTFSHPISTLSSSSTSSTSEHSTQWKKIPADRRFSSTSQETKKDDTQQQHQQQQHDDEPTKEESLKDTVRRMGGKHNAHKDDNVDPRVKDLLNKASSTWSAFKEEVGKAWGELLRSGERKDINKKLRHPEDTVEGEREYTGPVEIMVIDESEHLTAWQRMQKRLTEAPIIQGTNICLGVSCQPSGH